MTIASTAAARFIRKHLLALPIGEAALDAILDVEGIVVVDAPADTTVREFRRGRVIGIRVDQPSPWRFWLKAHALGHYLMHRGDQDEFSDAVIVRRQERQADEFAGHLLLWDALAENAAQLAEARGVPVECVERWMARRS